MKNLSAILVLSSALILLACIDNNNTPERTSEVDPEDIYFDYKISGEEGNDSVSVLLQFRLGEYGPTLLIEKPGKVTLDGKEIPVDSSDMTGPYYQVSKNIKEFTGKHTIIFINSNKKKYKEEFSFNPFTLMTVIPDTIRRGRLNFQFAGLENMDYVRILLTDTSFLSKGINRLDTVRNNQLVIGREDLKNLENGPIQLEFIKEDGWPIENAGWEGGYISIIYSLRREFILKDAPIP